MSFRMAPRFIGVAGLSGIIGGGVMLLGGSRFTIHATGAASANEVDLIGALLSLVFFVGLGSVLARKSWILTGAAIWGSAEWAFELGWVVLFNTAPPLPLLFSQLSYSLLFLGVLMIGLSLLSRGSRWTGVVTTLVGAIAATAVIGRAFWPFYVDWLSPSLIWVGTSPYYEAWLFVMGILVTLRLVRNVQNDQPTT